MSLFDMINMAIRNLWKRKLRTFLTVLGVIIGTASIVVMISVGIGMNEGFKQQIEQLGSLNVITVNKPYNYLLYQCQVIETDISDNHHNYLMKIKHTYTYTPEEYPFHQLKDYGIKTIRNVRKITSRLHQRLHQ